MCIAVGVSWQSCCKNEDDAVRLCNNAMRTGLAGETCRYWDPKKPFFPRADDLARAQATQRVITPAWCCSPQCCSIEIQKLATLCNEADRNLQAWVSVREQYSQRYNASRELLQNRRQAYTRAISLHLDVCVEKFKAGLGHIGGSPDTILQFDPKHIERTTVDGTLIDLETLTRKNDSYGKALRSGNNGLNNIQRSAYNQFVHLRGHILQKAAERDISDAAQSMPTPLSQPNTNHPSPDDYPLQVVEETTFPRPPAVPDMLTFETAFGTDPNPYHHVPEDAPRPPNPDTKYFQEQGELPELVDDDYYDFLKEANRINQALNPIPSQSAYEKARDEVTTYLKSLHIVLNQILQYTVISPGIPTGNERQRKHHYIENARYFKIWRVELENTYKVINEAWKMKRKNEGREVTDEYLRATAFKISYLATQCTKFGSRLGEWYEAQSDHTKARIAAIKREQGDL